MARKQINELLNSSNIQLEDLLLIQATSGTNFNITINQLYDVIQSSTSGFVQDLQELMINFNSATSGINNSLDSLNDIIFNSTSGIINSLDSLNEAVFNTTAGLNNRINELESDFESATSGINEQLIINNQLAKASKTGYGFSGAFAGKPLTNNYVWEAGEGIEYDSTDVANKIYKVFSLDRDVHLAVDQPYWTNPTPSDPTDIGLFAGQNLPNDVDTFFEFDYDYNTEYGYVSDTSGTAGTIGLDLTGFENSIGRIKLNDCVPGDQLRVRFDFNVIPKIANTTVEPALWYSNRDENDNITFTFPLTSSPIFYGTGTVGKTYLNRIEISAWITSTEDVNALVLPSIKADNQVTIQPIGMLVTILR